MLQQTALSADKAGLLLFAAASLIPPRLDAPPGPNPQPVSLAVSPYLGLGFTAEESPQESEDWLLAVSELIVFDTRRRGLASIESRFWHPPKAPENSPDAYALIRAWARDVWRRFAVDSPTAVVRLREIYPAKNASGETSSVRVAYRFLSADKIATPGSPSHRAPALRPEPASVRFAQGQFGGTALLPASTLSVELAPPQVSGVQPIRLDNRPRGDWPWGLSAMRVSVRCTDGMQGIAGPEVDVGGRRGRLWWQTLAYNVQYKVPDEPAKRQVLPRMFRARAIPSHLPNWPLTPLPTFHDLEKALSPGAGMSSATWQPILPGNSTALVSGMRPGVPFAFCESIQTQDLASNQVVQSGTVPVMHRTPRPVTLRPNVSTKLDFALQTWAGAFDPTDTLRTDADPCDTAFIRLANRDAVELRLVLHDSKSNKLSIDRGTILADEENELLWDGVLRFEAMARRATGDLSNPKPEKLLLDGTSWILSADLTDDTTTFQFEKPTAPDDATVLFEFKTPDDIKKWLKGRTHGASATVRVHAERKDETAGVAGYRQTLTFPLRVDRGENKYRLPYRPTFALFEDPEYNRRLSSSPAQKSAVVQVKRPPALAPAPNTASVTVTLAADRRECNTTGAINYLYFCDAANPADLTDIKTGDVAIKVVRNDPLKGPQTFELTTVKVSDRRLPSDTAGALDLASLAAMGGVELQPGDVLLFELQLKSGTTALPAIELAVSIVHKPVTPVPDAGYALLRRDPDDAVHCARFAFGPEPARLELLDPNDLLTQVVRRRAVFRWMDTVRSNQTSDPYALQKTTALGATHLPPVTNPS
jgi:hypothetical protein